jgi:lipopolysaccharide biosynthesis protein
MPSDLSLSPVENPTRLIAFYLPQFHPFPENDEWWGKGFTEWTNVTKAEPMFIGHYQPHLPADLGFYDLRVQEVRREQAAMAKSYGIDAFCYHFYWFSGKRLMERPLDEMLADTEVDTPFCLCWANENWTRRWDASEHEILISQRYRPEDLVDSLKAMEKYLRDPRYLTQDGKKLIVVYRPQHLPDSKAWTDAWREYAKENGLGELYLVCALTHGNWEYTKYGFDGGVEFPPHNLDSSASTSSMSELGFTTDFSGICVDYKDVAETYLNRDIGEENNVFRTVYPAWDNTARRKKRALVTLNGVPDNYEYWLDRTIKQTEIDFPSEERLVFINAWNEWAEGCHLEPDHKYGHSFLQATQNAKSGSKLKGWSAEGIPSECDASAQKKAIARSNNIRTVHPKRKTFLRTTMHSIRDALRVLRAYVRSS